MNSLWIFHFVAQITNECYPAISQSDLCPSYSYTPLICIEDLSGNLSGNSVYVHPFVLSKGSAKEHHTNVKILKPTSLKMQSQGIEAVLEMIHIRLGVLGDQIKRLIGERSFWTTCPPHCTHSLCSPFLPIGVLSCLSVKSSVKLGRNF